MLQQHLGSRAVCANPRAREGWFLQLIATGPIAIPRIDILGIYPPWQTLLAQVTVLLAVVTEFVFNVRSAPVAAKSA